MKLTLKRMALFLFILVLMAALCACSGKADSDTTSKGQESASDEPSSASSASDPQPIEETEPTVESEATQESSTEEWLPDGPVEPIVIEAYTGTVAPTITTAEECTYSLPRIMMPGPYIEEINSEIFDTFYVHATDYAYSHYDSYVTGNFLTVIVTYHTVYPGESAVEEYAIYTINIEKCRLATQEEILESADMTESAFREKARAALIQAFVDSVADSDLTYSMTDVEETTDRYLENAFPYFAPDGSLWVHGIRHQLAGQGECPCVAPLTTE